MSRTLHLLVGLALAAGLAVGTPAGPSVAQTVTFDDRVGERGDRYRPDLTSVSVRHSTHRLRVRVRGTRDGGWDAVYLVHVDTDGDSRPEYVIDTYLEAPHRRIPWWVRRVDSFGLPSQRRQVCSGEDATLHQRPGPVFTVSVPRRCLGRPDRVRVDVWLVNDTFQRVESAPGVRTWGPRVASGRPARGEPTELSAGRRTLGARC
jgi:hypothetical protein